MNALHTPKINPAPLPQIPRRALSITEQYRDLQIPVKPQSETSAGAGCTGHSRQKKEDTDEARPAQTN